MKSKPTTDVVKNLKVDKSDFDAALMKLIAAKPIHRSNKATKSSSAPKPSR